MARPSLSEEDIFQVARRIEAGDARRAYLDHVCGENMSLHEQISALLAVHDKDDGFLESPASAIGAGVPPTLDQPISEKPGTHIGPYKLLQQIGEGGFGVVFMAEQARPMRRQVALKVLKPGMDTRQVVARFEAERQALALMDHPNIARVFDGGETVSGRPFFVMELVRGIPITDFCDQNHLPVGERLGLFLHVCHAVQHAHQKGIIHRDLKPTNVLVTLHDATAVVKVIDFGIAKATGQQLTDKTLFTNFAQMVGTPLYMSPEQAQMSGLDIDTRTDIYALGVLLYELLTGTTPFDKERLRTAGYDEIRRIIREEEPAKPSTRISTMGLAGVTVSADRNSDPRRLSQLMRGELDWIVMKALDKDRNRRYESANAFAADIERYLNDEPVQACPPSPWYRFRKFARRNKRAVVTAAAVALAVMLGVVGLATSNLLIARSQRETADALQELRRDSYFHRITLAHRELLVDNLGRALKLLDECPEELRQWEWYYLQRLCRVEPVTLQGQGKGIRGLAFSSPDGRRVATANEDGTVGLFDLKTGAELPPLVGHTDKVRSVAFDRLSTRLASASADRTVKVWDWTMGRVIFNLSGNVGSHASGSYGVTFSPDGGRLAVGDADGNVVLYDMADGKEVRRLPGHQPMAVCVDFSPDGRLLASGDWSGVLRVWDVQTGRLLRTAPGNDAPMSAAKFSADGRRLATTSYDRLVNIWEVDQFLDEPNSEPTLTWRAHDCIVVGLAFSPDGRRLASIGGEDKTVKLWDPLTGREVLKLRGHTFFGICVAFSPDGGRLASSGLDGTIRIWDATPLETDAGQELLTLKHDDEVWSVACSPDGKRIASASFDKTVRIWDTATGASVCDALRHPSQVSMLAFSRDENSPQFASICRDRTARIFDANTGGQLHAFRTPNDHLYGVTFSPDSQYLLVDDVVGKHVEEGEDNAVTIWDASADQTAPKEVGIVGRHGEPVWCLKFSPDRQLLASASNDGTIKLWRWDPSHPEQAHEPLQILPVRHYGFGDCVAFDPTSEYLVTVGEERSVKIWDVKTGDLLHTLRGHSGDVVAVAVSPDGRWLASAGEDTTIALWDATNLSRQSPTPTRRHTLRGHTGMVMSLAFTPDSRRLVSGSRDSMIKVWDMTQWDEVPQR